MAPHTAGIVGEGSAAYEAGIESAIRYRVTPAVLRNGLAESASSLAFLSAAAVLLSPGAALFPAGFDRFLLGFLCWDAIKYQLTADANLDDIGHVIIRGCLVHPLQMKHLSVELAMVRRPRLRDRKQLSQDAAPLRPG